MADIATASMALTTEQTAAVKRAVTQIGKRQAAYKRFADYYDGEQRLTFASTKYRNAFGRTFDELVLNVCVPVVEGLTDRLQIEGFGIKEKDESIKSIPLDEDEEADDRKQLANDRIAKLIDQIWDDNRMDQGAGEVHQEAAIEGDAYVIVWPDADGNPVIYPNQAALMTVCYDQEKRGALKWAAKLWIDEEAGMVRLNLYYADRIEKYRSRAKNAATSSTSAVSASTTFVPYEVEGEAWPLPNEYGQVPVFHFVNNGRIGQFGRSELKIVLPVQDAINKTISDMLVGMETQALPQRWVTGMELPVDEQTGKPINPWTSEPGSVWVANGNGGTGTSPTFGQFAPADIERFLKAKDSFKMDVAVITGTPLHYMQLNTGNPPSGEALQTAEARHVKKVADREGSYGNTWADVMQFALKVAGQDGVQVETQWTNPAPISRLTLLNELVLTQEITNPVLLEKAGFSEDEVAQLTAGNQSVGAAIMSNFTNGPGQAKKPPLPTDPSIITPAAASIPGGE